MSENRILYSECIRIYEVEESFIESLHDSGLIHVVEEEGRRDDIERFLPKWEILGEGLAIRTVGSRPFSVGDADHRLGRVDADDPG